MIYTFNPTGVCPSEIKIELDEQIASALENFLKALLCFSGAFKAAIGLFYNLLYIYGIGMIGAFHV